jgi:hypothetical protein
MEELRTYIAMKPIVGGFSSHSKPLITSSFVQNANHQQSASSKIMEEPTTRELMVGVFCFCFSYMLAVFSNPIYSVQGNQWPVPSEVLEEQHAFVARKPVVGVNFVPGHSLC